MYGQETTIPSTLVDVERYGGFLYFPSTPTTLYLLDEISSGHALDINKALQEHDIELLVLNSPGGDVENGLLIASKVHDTGISTLIAPNGICASACSYIFLAGKSRIAGANSRLGVHRFAPNVSVKRETQETFDIAQEIMGNVYGTVNSFDIPDFVFSKMLGTSSDDMYWFRESQMQDIQRGKVSDALLLSAAKVISDRNTVLKSDKQIASIKTPKPSKPNIKPSVLPSTPPRKQQPNIKPTTATHPKGWPLYVSPSLDVYCAEKSNVEVAKMTGTYDPQNAVMRYTVKWLYKDVSRTDRFAADLYGDKKMEIYWDTTETRFFAESYGNWKILDDKIILEWGVLADYRTGPKHPSNYTDIGLCEKYLAIPN